MAEGPVTFHIPIKKELLVLAEKLPKQNPENINFSDTINFQQNMTYILN